MNKTFKKFYLPYRAEVETMSPVKYKWEVDTDLWGNEEDMDFDEEGNNVFKVIKVIYPESYYACPQYLTSKTLKEECKRNGVFTLEQLELLIRDMVEI